MSTRVIDRGAKRILREIDYLKKKPYIKIGINQNEFKQAKEVSEGEKSSPYTLGQVAAAHEFGTKNNRPPQRSFIRSTTDKKRSEWRKITIQLKSKIFMGLMTVSQALDVIGLKFTSDMQSTIQSGIKPTLAKSTLKKKTVRGKVGTTPLIDTGQLIGAITYVKNQK